MEKFEIGPLQKEWVKTLREYPERQHSGSLGYKDEEGWHLCCLGQLHVLANRDNLPINREGKVCDDGYKYYLDSSYSSYGLNGHKGYIIGDSVLLKNKVFSSLAEMNDGEVSWPEIADFIEANPEKVFTKPV